jgi:sialidase-1
MKTTITILLLAGTCLWGGHRVAIAEPLYEIKDIFIAGLDGVREYRIPALATTNTGMLIAICDARIKKPGDAINNIDLAMKRSADNGRTWEPVQFIADFPGEEAACDSSVVVDRMTDTIWVLYDHILDKPERATVRKRELRTVNLHLIKSRDDGVTWSEPTDITQSVNQIGWETVMSAPGSGIQMRDSSLVFPCYTRRPDQDHSHMLISADHGKTWTISADAGGKVDECQVVELANGSALLNMRSERGKGCRAIASTSDGGKSWEKLVDDVQLPDPKCQGSFIRHTELRDGFRRNRLLFANAANSSQSVNMTVRLSYDEGKTWPIAKVIYSGPSAYSCLTVLQDGSIGLLYENGQATPYETITFARFNLQWLTDGRDREAPLRN